MIHLLVFILAFSKSDDSRSTELAEKIKNGNHKAFKAFFKAHQESLSHFLMGKGIAKETAEDLIQQAFVYIWEKRSDIDASKSLRAYLFKIAYTRMLNHIRDHRKFDQSVELPVRESVQNPEDSVQARELQQAIDRTIAEMPEKRGLVFDMCFMQEFTYKETAEVLGVSVKTVENHMGLAFKDIRAALKIFK